jgi:hypothetical protein
MCAFVYYFIIFSLFNNIIIFVWSKLLHIANDLFQKSELSNQWITEVPFV